MAIKLTVLPETIAVDCGAYEDGALVNGEIVRNGKHPYAGLIATVKPLDLESWARWADDFPDDTHRRAAATLCVKQQLVGLAGLAMVEADGSERAYDHARDFRALPADLVSFLYGRLMERSALTGAQEKNSDSPSGSDGTRPSAA